MDETRAELSESGELSEIPSSITRAEMLIAQRGDPLFKELISKRLEEDRAISEEVYGILVKGSQKEERRRVIVPESLKAGVLSFSHQASLAKHPGKWRMMEYL